MRYPKTSSLADIPVFHDKHFCQTIREQNKFSQKLFQWGLNPQPPDHQSDALLTKSLFGCFCESLRSIKSCSIDSRNEQSPTCQVLHETNKAHFRNLQQIPSKLSCQSMRVLIRRSWVQTPLEAICDKIYEICSILGNSR